MQQLGIVPYLLNTLPTLRKSVATPSSTVPVPSNTPLAVPQLDTANIALSANTNLVIARLIVDVIRIYSAVTKKERRRSAALSIAAF